MRASSLSMLLVLLAVMVMAQSHTPAPTGPRKGEGLSKVPSATINFRFKGDEVIPPLPEAGPAMEYPLQCGSGGRYFVNMVLPPEYSTTQLYSISQSKGIVKYVIALATDLHDVTIKSYTPTTSGVLFVVTATRDDQQRKYTTRTENGDQVEKTLYSGDHGDYLVEFDNDGNYKGAVEIDKGFTITRVAMVESNMYLAYGIAVSDRRSHLALLDSDGVLVRLIDPPKALADIDKEQSKAISSVSPFGFAAWVQFVEFQGKILVVPGHSRGAILAVRSSGEVTVATLKLPEGLTIDALIPSADRWYIRASSSDASREYAQTRVYEFAPEGGAMLRQLSPKGANAAEIACEVNGEFIAFTRDDSGKLRAMHGTVE